MISLVSILCCCVLVCWFGVYMCGAADVLVRPHTGEGNETLFELKQWCISHIPQEQKEIPKGSHKFPFVFKLPLDVRSSYLAKHAHTYGDRTIKVEYTIKVECKVKGMFKRNPRCSHIFQVNPPKLIAAEAYHAVTEDVTEMMRDCCFSTGTCYLKATLPKHIFRKDEPAVVCARVHNDSPHTILAMKVTVGQEFFVCTKRKDAHDVFSGDQTCLRRILWEYEFKGVAKRSALHERKFQFQVSTQRKRAKKAGADFYPTFNGILGSIRHFVIVSCVCACAPNIEVELPIVLTDRKVPEKKVADVKVAAADVKTIETKQPLKAHIQPAAAEAYNPVAELAYNPATFAIYNPVAAQQDPPAAVELTPAVQPDVVNLLLQFQAPLQEDMKA